MQMQACSCKSSKGRHAGLALGASTSSVCAKRAVGQVLGVEQRWSVAV